jgi:diguanylate cyclase (GGDEF)-like protein/PAS domain S-box-containing protein
MVKSKILVVGGEDAIQTAVREAFAKNGCQVLQALSVRQAVDALAGDNPIDVALVDNDLQDGSGMEVARALREQDPSAEVLLMTRHASLESAVEALKIGAFDYLTKPIGDIDELVHHVQNALDKVQLKRSQARLHEELRANERRYALVARAANDGLWDWDLVDNRACFSARWKQMLGFEEDEIGDSVEEWLQRVHADDLQRVRSALEHHLDGHLDPFRSEHRIRHKNGTYRWMLTRGMAERDESGRAVRMAGSQTDITERRIAEQQLQHDALHDRVTFLPNRVLFLDRLGLAMARARRRPEYRFAVVLLDLDRFKFVNESLGHSVGDQLLAATARRLETTLRAGDTAARLGGDEFAVILDEITDVTDAICAADRVQQELSIPLYLDGKEVFSTASIGIAISSPEHERPEDLLRDADIAMYRAKALGKARHVVFDPTMQRRAVVMLELDAALRHAIERREFVLHYQPIVSLDSGGIVGFEALVRWMHPERGMLLPKEFIPTAEDTGLIVPMGDLVIEAAARQLSAWREQLGLASRLYVSINLSSKHLTFPGLVEKVGAVLMESRLPPSSLRLEITESAIMESSDVVSLTLERLKALDVQLYMDDFGTGYSSLSYLHRLPIDTLKIDRSFVSNLGIEGENSVIVHTIVTLARVLGMEVIAEGVENGEQLAQLRALHCDHGQGYHFSGPVPAVEAAELLARQPEW